MPPANPLPDHPSFLTPPRPVIALVADLIFGSKITATAGHLKLPVQVLRSAETLRAAAPNASGVFIDLNVPGLDGPALIRALKTAHPALHVLGFLSHVQVDLAEAARAAGADDVVPRSQFSSQLPKLLARYAGFSAPPTDSAAASP